LVTELSSSIVPYKGGFRGVLEVLKHPPPGKGGGKGGREG